MDRYESELRRALRWYPRHYRERHGDEIVATALDSANQTRRCRGEPSSGA